VTSLLPSGGGGEGGREGGEGGGEDSLILSGVERARRRSSTGRDRRPEEVEEPSAGRGYLHERRRPRGGQRRLE
jgi:hypothetical protein